MAIKVFLSATFSDLRDERLEVLEVFRRLRTVEKLDVDLITMEDFGFSELAPVDKCIEQLEFADAYLGIIGFRYGSIVPGGKLSYTEREYRHAHKRQIPIFVLQKEGMVDGDHIENDPDKLRRLNELRRSANDNHVVLRYNTRAELGRALTQFLPGRLKERFPELGKQKEEEDTVPFFQQRDRPVLLKADQTDIKRLDVLAWSSLGLLRDRSLLETYIKHGCEIRIINIKRGGTAANLLSRAAGKTDFDDDLRMAISRVRRFAEFTSSKTGSIKLREIDWIPSSTLFIANSAIAWVGTYTPNPKTPGGDKWVVELREATQGDALKFYIQQFEDLWRVASQPDDNGNLDSARSLPSSQQPAAPSTVARVQKLPAHAPVSYMPKPKLRRSTRDRM